MKLAIAALSVLLSGGVAFAVVGGGDLTMKNDGGDVVFSHDVHVKTAGLTSRIATPNYTSTAKTTRQ